MPPNAPGYHGENVVGSSEKAAQRSCEVADDSRRPTSGGTRLGGSPSLRRRSTFVSMTPRALVLALVALAACARASTIAPAGTSAGATSADITEADLRRRLFLIADDSMMGRETGSEGAHKTTEYIASEFKRLG